MTKVLRPVRISICRHSARRRRRLEWIIRVCQDLNGYATAEDQRKEISTGPAFCSCEVPMLFALGRRCSPTWPCRTIICHSPPQRVYPAEMRVGKTVQYGGICEMLPKSWFRGLLTFQSSIVVLAGFGRGEATVLAERGPGINAPCNGHREL